MTKDIVKIELKADVEEVVKSCVRIFGEARAEEVLNSLYKGTKLKKALAFLDELELAQEEVAKLDIDEINEMSEIEIDERGDSLMHKKVTKQEVENLDLHVDNDGIDALTDDRVVNSDHGIDNRENTLEYWMSNLKDEEIFDTPFKEVYTHLDNGAYPGVVVSVSRFYGQTKTFGNKVIPGGWRFVINVKMEPVYSKAEHRGYFLEVLPIYMSANAFKSYCDEVGWEFGNRESMRGKKVNIVVDVDQVKKSKTYFIQGK